MRYLQLIDTYTYSQHLPAILLAFASLGVLAGFIIYRVYEYNSKQQEKFHKPQRFRLEITEMGKDYVRTGLDVPLHIDGASIGSTLRTGLTIIAKKDPLVLRILLLQTLEVLSAEEDIQQILNRIHLS